LVVEAENGSLPEDLVLNVLYGSNREGEPYRLSDPKPGQAVFCDAEPEDGSAGASSEVESLRCELYTQGPAELDATASGYETIEDMPLSLDSNERCAHEIKVTLRRAADAGGVE
jgi:hypothetical protein